MLESLPPETHWKAQASLNGIFEIPVSRIAQARSPQGEENDSCPVDLGSATKPLTVALPGQNEVYAYAMRTIGIKPSVKHTPT